MEPDEKVCSRKSSNDSSYCLKSTTTLNDYISFGNHQNGPNEWESLFSSSAPSDYLSQSLASSTSWSDEFEGDVAKTFKDQMIRVENTLYGDSNQQLPTNSSIREECSLWQKKFPHLRIVGEAVRPSIGCQTQSGREEIEEHIEEIIAAHGDYEDDISSKALEKVETTQDSNEIYKEKIKKAVLDRIFARVWPEVVKKIEPLLRRRSAHQGKIRTAGAELAPNEVSLDNGLISEFDSLSIADNIVPDLLRTRSGRRSGIGSRNSINPVVPLKPVVLEYSIPIPRALTVRTCSAIKRSPKPVQGSLAVKYLSPERLLSPLVLQSEKKTPVKSGGGCGTKGSREYKQECKPWPQYDAQTGRKISRDRCSIRRNVKTSPPMPEGRSRHGALPPIEISDNSLKVLNNVSKRSSSAFFKGSRHNMYKNQVVLSPLDSFHIRQSAVIASMPHNHTYTNWEHQLFPADQQQRWKNRRNKLKK